MLWKVQASYINANFSSPKPHTAIEQRGPGAREASRANRDPVTAHHVRDFLLFTGQEQVPLFRFPGPASYFLRIFRCLLSLLRAETCVYLS
jgi:hypothetical protein